MHRGIAVTIKIVRSVRHKMRNRKNGLGQRRVAERTVRGIGVILIHHKQSEMNPKT